MFRTILAVGIILSLSTFSGCQSSTQQAIIPTNTPTIQPIGPQLVVERGFLAGGLTCQYGNNQISCQRDNSSCQDLATTVQNSAYGKEFFYVDNTGDESLTWFGNVTRGNVEINPTGGVIPPHISSHGMEVDIVFHTYESYHLVFQTTGQQVDVDISC